MDEGNNFGEINSKFFLQSFNSYGIIFTVIFMAFK